VNSDAPQELVEQPTTIEVVFKIVVQIQKWVGMIFRYDNALFLVALVHFSEHASYQQYAIAVWLGTAMSG
jgi:hypothetical protein